MNLKNTTAHIEDYETGERMTVEIQWDRHGFTLHFAGEHVGTFDVNRHPRFHSHDGSLVLDKPIQE